MYTFISLAVLGVRCKKFEKWPYSTAITSPESHNCSSTHEPIVLVGVEVALFHNMFDVDLDDCNHHCPH